MTKIEWTQGDDGVAGKTWNPTRGCTLVSAGCTNCYAQRQAHRFSGPGGPYEGLTKLTKNGPVWNGKIRLVPEKLNEPLRWRKPRRVFVNSMSDLFHEGLTNVEIASVFGVMAATPRHTFQVLTKRPKRMSEWMRWVRLSMDGHVEPPNCVWHYVKDLAHHVLVGCSAQHDTEMMTGEEMGVPSWPLPNVWLGVSVEDQKTADERIPLLLQTPAAVRFISAEPLLAPVDLATGTWGYCVSCNTTQPRGCDEPCAMSGCDWTITRDERDALDQIDWVIVGGESGPGARPCNVRWIRSLMRQCRDADVACFLKQLGSWAYDPITGIASAAVKIPQDRRLWLVKRRLRDRKGGDPSEWPEDLRVREWPRRHA